MSIRIELLGKVRLIVAGVELRCGHTPLMCLLAIRAPNAVRRSELLETLYPHVGRKEALNRLRVGLTRIRAVIPLLEDSETVRIDTSKVEIDLYSLSKSAKDTAPTSDDEEFRALLQSIDSLQAPLLPGVDERWAEAERLAWSFEAVGRLIRLAELADARNDWDVQCRAAIAGLRHIPHDEELWSHLLMGSARAGRASEILLQWAKCRRAQQAEGSDFSAELVDLARSLKERAGSGRAHFGTDEEEVIVRLAGRLIQEDPAALQGMLRSPSFMVESKRHPIAALRLLDTALESGPRDTADSLGCKVARVATLGFLDRWREALAEGDLLLDSAMEPKDRQRLLSSMSFGSVFAGDLKEGLAYLTELLRLCEAEGWDHEGWIARCANASCQWMLTDFEASNELFTQCIAYLESVSDKDVGPFLAVTRSNQASLLADMGLLEDALKAVRVADSQARKLGSADTSCRTAATLARVLYCLDQAVEASAHARRAIRIAVRQSAIRLHVNTLENIGIGLSAGTDIELGASLMRAGWAIRRAHSLPTEALFLWRRRKFAPSERAPDPIEDSKLALVDAYRTLELSRLV